jgi:SAM-dependent methyltransferase
VCSSDLALLLQLLALLVTQLAMAWMGLTVTPYTAALLCGALAALFSVAARMAAWWPTIQLLFLPALLWARSWHFPPALFLGLFLLLLAIYWSTFRTQVPLFLSGRKVWQALESLLPQQRTQVGFRFMDLGSGLGGVLTHLARARPDGSYNGVEIAPLPFMWSWLRIRWGRHANCTVQRKSLWDCELSHYDVVFAYLSPVPMERLWRKARAEMRPGSLLISSTFAIPGQQPNEMLQVDDARHTTLLVWRM